MKENLKIGFTSGRFDSERELLERINACKSLGCTAMEIGFHLPENVPLIKNIDKLKVALSGFVVSFHGPTRIRYDNSQETRLLFDRLDEIVKAIKPHIFIIHADLIDNPEVLIETGWPLGIENSDWRKPFGKYPSEMEEVLSKIPSASMVYDLNHVYTNDRTMALAKEFWPRFKDRIRHIHISGFVDESLFHNPLYRSNCEIIIDNLPTKDVPIILESGGPKLANEDLPKELNYFLEKIQ